MSTFYAHVALETESLIDNLTTVLTHDQLKQFILDLDLIVADVQFTEELILCLAKSLKGCTDEPLDFINWEKI
jgi:hypothetical protein